MFPVPHLRGVVANAGREECAVRTERHVEDVAVVLEDDGWRVRVAPVPHPRGVVVTHGRDLRAVRTERDPVHRAGVARENQRLVAEVTQIPQPGSLIEARRGQMNSVGADRDTAHLVAVTAEHRALAAFQCGLADRGLRFDRRASVVRLEREQHTQLRINVQLRGRIRGQARATTRVARSRWRRGPG